MNWHNHPILLCHNGLPKAFAARVTRAFEALGCSLPPLQTVTRALVDIASLRHICASEALGRTFLCIVAACHTACRLCPPPAPFVQDFGHPPTVAEWLLLAVRERVQGGFSRAVEDAIDVVIDRIDVAASCSSTPNPAHWPVADYGLGTLLTAIVEPIENEAAAVNEVGIRMGKLARLSHEVHTITRPGRELSYPYVLRDIAREPDLQARLSLAIALASQPGPDNRPLISALGHQRIGMNIAAACALWTSGVTNAIHDPVRDVVRVFLDSMHGSLLRKIQGIRLFGFAAAPSLDAELDRSIALVVDALAMDPELHEAWEIQRSGGVFPRTVVGKFFPRALGALALDAAGIDITMQASELLAHCGTDGFRYFDDFAAIPPDADDLGMALQLLARSSPHQTRLESLIWPVEVLVRNSTADGEIPVWFTRDLRDPLGELIPTWRGSRCIAVAANATIGLIESGVHLPHGFIERSMAWIVRTWKIEGMKAVFFYGLRYTQFVLMRLHSVARDKLAGKPVIDDLRSIADEICSSICDSQRGDGGFGGIIDTACALAALACGHGAFFDPWPAVTYLVSRQRHDGLWNEEPLYPTPGKNNTEGSHGSRTITSSLCLYALARVRSKFHHIITLSDSQGRVEV